MKTLLIGLFLFIYMLPCSLGQGLDNMPQRERDSLLLTIARSKVLQYGDKKYYTLRTSEKIIKEIPSGGAHPGEKAYVVVYGYDTIKYAISTTKIHFLENTGLCYSVMFANDFGYIIEWIEREGRTVEKVPFNVSTLEELYKPALEFFKEMQRQFEKERPQWEKESEARRIEHEAWIEKQRKESLERWEEWKKLNPEAWKILKEQEEKEQREKQQQKDSVNESKKCK